MTLESAWGVVKFLASVFLAPFAAPIVAWRAAANHARAGRQRHLFPHQLDAVAGGRTPVAPAHRVEHLSASIDAVVVSDLHRCYAGRRNWPIEQHTTELYEVMLDHYGAAGWHVIENGDADDFWMVGGSPYGVRYDITRLVLAVRPGEGGRRARRALARGHLDRLIEANRGVFDRLARLGAEGRYHRTVGNHDDTMLDPSFAADVERRLGVRPVDWIALTDGGRAEAVITHGHQTDAWNAPHRALLGRLAMWFANTIDDVPGLRSPEALPDDADTDAVLGGRRANRLTRIPSRFGANASYDSLDEERLFDVLGGAAVTGPWLLLGHTHIPLLAPVSSTGAVWSRYANSGHALWREMITALEWPGSDGPDRAPRLVAWCFADVAARAGLDPEVVASGTSGRDVVRVEMEPVGDGRRLRPRATSVRPV